MIHVCCPVIRRYDLLREMLFSLEKSVVKADMVHVIDNGQDGRRLKIVLDSVDIRTDVFTPITPLGVAESWNWFMRNVPEERIIVNDDILFSPHSIERLLASDAALVWAADPKGASIGFSCFVLRDACIETIGYFDETISPGYGYYEDDDYLQRLDGHGTAQAVVKAEVVRADVLHLKSATLKAYTNAEMQEHHRKFLIAQANYAKKWNVVFS